MPASGRFITLEGGEGAGKSTQVRRLADALRARGHTVTTTREPGGSEGAEAIRALLVSGATDRWEPLTEALLHAAARRDHLVRTVWPALERGEWVISDRFADSSIAYQGYGQGLGPELVGRIQAMALDRFAPDLTLVLDVPPEVGLARAGGRGGAEDRYERMDGDFHARVRAGFLALAAEAPARYAVIDATQGAEQVEAALLAAVTARLGA